MKHLNTLPVFSLALGLAAASAWAASPAQVRQRVADNEKLTFVDVRSTAVFQKGHIPGAINIPAGLAPLKGLPPLGRVVVYDDGLGANTSAAAAAALNQKPGIQAEVLEGGFAAWESAQGTTTKPPGMSAERLPMITYAQLKQRQDSDVVLVDLRTNPVQTATGSKVAQAAPALTDLSGEFPKARTVRSPFEGAASPRAKIQGPSAPVAPFYVLIDSGDGSAQAMAHALKANGITRFAILAGGESILERQGQPGLQRIGTSITVQRPAGAPASTPQQP